MSGNSGIGCSPVCTFRFPLIPFLKMRTVLVRVLVGTPKAGLFCACFAALAAAMVRVPFLAPEALAWAIFCAPIPRVFQVGNTPVDGIAKVNAVFEHPLLDLLIFKSYFYPPYFGAFPFVPKPREVGQLELISLLYLIFENVIIQIRVYSCDDSLIFYFLTFIRGGPDITT